VAVTKHLLATAAMDVLTWHQTMSPGYIITPAMELP